MAKRTTSAKRQKGITDDARALGVTPATDAPDHPGRLTFPKARATFHLPEALVEEMRDAVIHLSGPPVRLTMAALAGEAIKREVARLRKKHNGGKAFPKRAAGPRGGRPVGS
jgi:hypothetical protein